MLHLNRNTNNKDVSKDEKKEDNNELALSKSVAAHVSNNTNHDVLLAMAVVQVVSTDGQALFARALLDSASMNNFVNFFEKFFELAQSLQLK